MADDTIVPDFTINKDNVLPDYRINTLHPFGSDPILTVGGEQMQPPVKGLIEKEEKAKEEKGAEEAEEVINSIRSSDGTVYTNNWGRFKSELDFTNATQDELGVFSGVTYSIIPSKEFTANGVEDILNYGPMAGNTLEELLREQNKRDQVVRRSADITWHEAKDPDGKFIHGETTAAIKKLEETVWNQMKQGVYDAIPVGLGRTAFLASAAVLPPQLKATVAFPIGLGTFAYSLWRMDVYTPDMAEEIFKNQMNEIDEKEKAGYYTDKNAPRVLTVDQIRDRLDPEFASFYTKTMNAIARNAPASALILIGGGGVAPVDRLINIVTGGRLGKSAKALKKAEQHFINQNKAIVEAGGVALSKPTQKELVYRAGIILKEDLKKETDNLRTGFLRFIYGFNTNQKIEQMRNPLNYLLRWGFGEVGAGGGMAFAAYTDAYLTGGLQTQTIDKIPYAAAGAMLLPKLGGLGITGARTVAGILGYIATTPATMFQSKNLTNVLTNPAINERVYNWLSGKNKNLPTNIDGVTTKELFDLREQLARYDMESGGVLIDNLKISMQTVGVLDEAIKNSGNKELIDNWDPRQALGLMTQLDIITAIENRYLVNRLHGKTPTMENIDPKFAEIQDARAIVLQNGETLIKLLLDSDLAAFSNKPLYSDFVANLSTKIADSKVRTTQLEKLGDSAIAYRYSVAVSDLMVTAEKEGLSPITLEKARNITDILDNNPDFAKNFKIQDEVTNEILTGVNAVKAYKKSIQLAITQIYENSKRADIEINELYTKGDGNVEKINEFRKRNASNGEVLASNFYAHTNMTRVQSVMKTNRNNYTTVGKNSEDGFVDVTDMYIAIEDKLTSATKANIPEDIDAIKNSINLYLRTAVNHSVDDWFTNYGPGSPRQGYDMYEQFLKRTNVKLHSSLPDFGNKKDLASWLIKNQENLRYPFKILATLGDVKGINDKIKSAAFDAYGADKMYKPNLPNRLKQSQRGLTWDEIKEITNTEYVSKLSKVDKDKLKAAHNNFRDVVIPMRGSTIYANSHGSIKNPNVKSITGFSHGPDNRPDLWLNKVFQKLQKPDTAKAFWNDFIDFYGPAEIDGVRNDDYHNALTAISDYLQFRVHQASEGVLYSTKGDEMKIIGVDPDVTSPQYIEQVEVPEASPITGTPPLVDETFVREIGIKEQIVEGTPRYTSKFEHNAAFSAIINLEKASNGKFAQNLAYDSVKRLYTIVSEGGAGAKIIKDTVKKATKNIKIASEVSVTAKATLKANSEVIGDVLKITYSDRGNTAKLAERILENPETYDMLIKQLDMSRAGNSMTSKGLLQYIITDGLINLSKKEIYKISKAYGLSDTIVKTDGMILKEYFNKYDNILRKVFDPEHFSLFKKINNYLLRFVAGPEGDISDYKFTRPDGLNIQYSNTKVMNRIWTTQIGKTNPSWLGIEALAATLFNTNSEPFGALMLNKYVAAEFHKFLVEGKLPANVIKTSQVTFLDQWVALANGMFGVKNALGFTQSMSEDEHERQKWMRRMNIKSNDPKAMEKWQRYKANVGGNAILQSYDAAKEYGGYALDSVDKAYDYLSDQMDMLF